MAQSGNPLVRLLVPVVIGIVAIGIAWAVFKNTKAPSTSQSTPAQTAPSSQPPSQPDAQAQSANQPQAAPATSAPPNGRRYHAQVFAPAAAPTPIGSLEPTSGADTFVEFSPSGAGIRRISLTNHFDTLKDDVHTVVQASIEPPQNTGPSLVSMAALGVYVNSQFVPLVASAEGIVWQETGPGAFDAVILDDQDVPVLRIERRYTVEPGSFRINLAQRAFNLTDKPVQVQWLQLGPVDLPQDSSGYGGDKRRSRFGYLMSASADPSRRAVVSHDFVQDHPALVGKVTGGVYAPSLPLWPNEKSKENSFELTWAALTNRYFAVAVHTPATGNNPPAQYTLAPFTSVDRVAMVPGNMPASGNGTDAHVALRLTSTNTSVDAGKAADFSVSIYAGPMSRPLLRANPVTKSLGLDGLVHFNFGGPCGFCTFEWLSTTLFWLMHAIHDYLVHDWSLAIILLVVCVRTVLHPVTKWTQVRMQRFGKQMQGMAPKQKIIQERYKDDRKKLQEETAKLWREEGISPLGAVGCLPMFLVMPVWIALYAMLYFAFELRHAHAFFGVFQKLSNNQWGFLGDLASPDRAINFGTSFSIPLLGSMTGPISSLNVLPLILGVVFFVHQKYLTPPTSTQMTPEQEMQQKMAKWISVILFPIFMYNAPSGLALYFVANSTLAIFENKYIRAHIDKHDLLNVEKHRNRKPSGFMARLQSAVEQRAKAYEQQRRNRQR